MRLWTIQPIEVWNETLNSGTYRCNPVLTTLDLDDEYKWMIRKMVDRIGPPPVGVQYPIWAWYKQNGKHCKPDLRSARWGYGLGDEDYACIEIEMPDETILLSDFDVWHIILNHGLISETEEEDKEQEILFDAMDSDQQALYRDKNWERVFEVSPFSNGWITRGDWVQATFWELQKEDIRSVKFFRTASRKIELHTLRESFVRLGDGKITHIRLHSER